MSLLSNGCRAKIHGRRAEGLSRGGWHWEGRRAKGKGGRAIVCARVYPILVAGEVVPSTPVTSVSMFRAAWTPRTAEPTSRAINQTGLEIFTRSRVPP